MDKIDDVLSLNLKPKEKIDKITDIILEEPRYMKNLINNFETGNDVKKGTYATVLKQVSYNDPELVEPFIDVLLEYINYKANRVKWGIPETIGNLAEKYPKKVEKAVPKLLLNTVHDSTVVRWCAAYALTKIAVHNKRIQVELVGKFNQIIEEEKNNGVKNVYLDVLKLIG